MERTLWEKVKPWLGGAVAGAIAMMAIGFFWFGWTTNDNAEKMAVSRVDAALKPIAMNVLAPMCAAQAQTNPVLLAEIGALSSYQRSTKLTEAGWTKFKEVELSTTTARVLADACGKILFDKAS